MNKNNKIYQIFYDRRQTHFLCPEFTALDNSQKVGDDRFEVSVMLRTYPHHIFSDAPYLGFVSWKFCEKTQIEASDFLSFIDQNPGYDLYYINPYPDTTFHRNIWHQGNISHPQLLELVRALFLEVDYNCDFLDDIYFFDDFLYCNFWVGNDHFWNQYHAYVAPITHYISTHPQSKTIQRMRQRALESGEIDYIPYILERIVCTMLHRSDSFKFTKLPYHYSCPQVRKKSLSRIQKALWCGRVFKFAHSVARLKYYFHR